MIIQGIKMQVSPKYPKQQLSNELIVTDKCRRETNEWLASFFGYHEVLKDGEILHAKQCNTMTMNQKTYDKLRHQVMNMEMQNHNKHTYTDKWWER